MFALRTGLNSRIAVCICLGLIGAIVAPGSASAEPQSIPLWSGEIPGPKPDATGPEGDLPERPGGAPIRRTTNITSPSLVVYEARAEKRTGAGLIVIPGGGFGYLTTDLEGSEACEFFATRGVTCFLLKHRAPTNKQAEPNAGPVLDCRRAVTLVRERADEWKLAKDKIGVLGFSAGGQVAAVSAFGPGMTETEAKASRPDLLLLIYPWGLYLPKEGKLRADLQPAAGAPPTFFAQALDDKASLAQGTTGLCTKLMDLGVPVELHLYEKGGHGFGVRPVAVPCPSDWPQRAADWLKLREWAVAK